MYIPWRPWPWITNFETLWNLRIFNSSRGLAFRCLAITCTPRSKRCHRQEESSTSPLETSLAVLSALKAFSAPPMVVSLCRTRRKWLDVVLAINLGYGYASRRSPTMDMWKTAAQYTPVRTSGDKSCQSLDHKANTHLNCSHICPMHAIRLPPKTDCNESSVCAFRFCWCESSTHGVILKTMFATLFATWQRCVLFEIVFENLFEEIRSNYISNKQRIIYKGGANSLTQLWVHQRNFAQ